MNTVTRSELRVHLSSVFAAVFVLPSPTPILAKGRILTLPSLCTYYISRKFFFSTVFGSNTLFQL